MKVLAKINRGVILTVVVLLGVAAYLIGLEVMHSSARKEIGALCEEYIQAELRYHMLPEEYRGATPGMTEAELDGYIAQMKEDLTPYYVDNEQTYRYLFNSLEESLRNQAQGYDVTYELTKDIMKTEITFDGDKASVDLFCYTTMKGTAAYAPDVAASTTTRDSSASGETLDTLYLQRVDGEWKLTYSNLTVPYAQFGGL